MNATILSVSLLGGALTITIDSMANGLTNLRVEHFKLISRSNSYRRQGSRRRTCGAKRRPDGAKSFFAGSGQDPLKRHDGSSLLFANHYRDQVNKLEVTSVLPDNSLAGATDLIHVLLDAISDQGEVLSQISDGLQELL